MKHEMFYLPKRSKVKTSIIIGVFLINFSASTIAAESKKIIVLGGGILGVISAYYLAEEGYDVTVVEQHDDVAKASSFANGAQLCYSCIHPIYSKSFSSKLLPHLETLQLGHTYLSRCSFFKGIENYLINKALNQELTEYRNTLFKQSSVEFKAITKKCDLSFPHQNNGILQLFFKEETFEKAIKEAEYKIKNGIKLTVLSPSECFEREPTLRFTKKDIKGGILMEQDGTGDTYLFTKALSEICRKLGVKFLFNTEIEKITFDGNQITSLVTKNKETLTANAYVISLGVSSKPLLAPLNINLPIDFVKGYSISIDLEEQDNLPLIGIADPSNEIFYAKLGNTLRAAGLTEYVGVDVSLNQEKIALLMNSIDDLFPQLKVREKEQTGKVHKWACLRPSSLTKVPFITDSKYDNLFINTGHGGYGWTLAPASGKLLAELVKRKI